MARYPAENALPKEFSPTCDIFLCSSDVTEQSRQGERS